jgi:hypothetical protein
VAYKKKKKVTFGKSGQGGRTAKISLSVYMLEELGITEEYTYVTVEVKNDKIEIRRFKQD